MFHNQTAVITGGSSGIGLALAKELRLRGARVVLISRSGVKLKKAQTVLAEIPGDPVNVFRCDVRNYRQLRRVFQEIEKSGPVRILINSAGMVHPGKFDIIPVSLFRRTMAANVLGTVHACRAAAPAMMSRQAGTIVNIGSLAGMIGVFGYTAYSASKFAVHGFTQALRAEMKPHGIHVMLAAPPDTDTPMLHEKRKLLPRESAAINASGGLLSPKAVALAIIRGIEKRRSIVVPGFEGKFAYYASRFIPGIVDAVMDHKIRKAQSGKP